MFARNFWRGSGGSLRIYAGSRESYGAGFRCEMRLALKSSNYIFKDLDGDPKPLRRVLECFYLFLIMCYVATINSSAARDFRNTIIKALWYSGPQPPTMQ